jgi:hypothetical protein
VQKVAFREPVFLWLDGKRRDFGTKTISSVHEGLAALHRFGLGDCRLDETGRPRREWAHAAAALTKARMEPSPDNVEKARRALCAVAQMARALAPAPPAPSPLQRAFSLFGAHV